MAKLFNLARMLTSTTGSGTVTLGSAAAGHLTFADAGVSDGDVVSYGISDGYASEVGRGTYSSTGPTLTRSLLRSSNSNNLLNLSGNAEVYITVLAEDIYAPDGTGSYTSSSNTFSNRPTSGSAGNMFFPTDGFAIYRDTGSAWRGFGPVFPLSPVPASGWTWYNQENATAVHNQETLYLSHNTYTGFIEFHLYTRTVPTPPYTVKALFSLSPIGGSYKSAGFVWSSGTSGSTAYSAVLFSTDAIHETLSISISHWWGTGSIDHSGSSHKLKPSNLIWLKFEDNNTDRNVYISYNNINWIHIFEMSRTYFITPERLGVCINSYEDDNEDRPYGLSVLSWEES